MAIDSPTPRCLRKRAAGVDSPTAAISLQPDAFDAPRILHRHQHRRRNIAQSLWGLDIPPTPTNHFATTPTIAGFKPPFSVYKALLRHPNLFFQFAVRLPYPAMIDLYAVDKEFHYRLNKYSVSLVHDYAKYHAPLASYIFSWVLYPDLCISDPMLKPMDGREWLARDVPSFRWVGMVLWRQKVVHSILTELALEGHRVPRGTEGTLMKFWCLMEMNTTALREAFLDDKTIWSDDDIMRFHLLLIKLDMRFSDPILGNGTCALSHMLLTQKSLSTLWKLLTGQNKLTYDDATDMLVRTHLTADLDIDNHTWLDDETENGVAEEQWGLLMREGWDEDGGRMESAVDMVIDEGLTRDLDVQQYLVDFVLWGSVDEKGGDLPVPRLFGSKERVSVSTDGRPRENEMIALRNRFM